MFDTHAHIISADTERYPRLALAPTQSPGPPGGCFDLEHLLQGMEAAGVTHACVVQRAFVYGVDNSYVLDAARLYPDKLTPVIVLKADDPTTPERLKSLLGRQRLGGLRLAPSSQEVEDFSWLDSPAAYQTWRVAADRDIPVAIFIPPRLLPLALPRIQKIAEAIPALKIVIDHLGINHRGGALVKKDRALGLPEPFLGPPDYAISDEQKNLRSQQNIYFKLTSINFQRLEEDKVPLGDFVKRLVSEFGAQRILWGSDIGQSEGDYLSLAEKARRATALLSSQDRDQICFHTATSLYRFPPPTRTHLGSV